MDEKQGCALLVMSFDVGHIHQISIRGSNGTTENPSHISNWSVAKTDETYSFKTHKLPDEFHHELNKKTKQ